MPNRKKKEVKRRHPRVGSPTGSNGSLGLSEANRQELEAKMAFPMPSREALLNQTEVSSNRDLQDPELLNPEHIQAQETMRSPLWNHDRMDSRKRYCLLATIHKATKWDAGYSPSQNGTP